MQPRHRPRALPQRGKGDAAKPSLRSERNHLKTRSTLSKYAAQRRDAFSAGASDLERSIEQKTDRIARAFCRRGRIRTAVIGLERRLQASQDISDTTSRILVALLNPTLDSIGLEPDHIRQRLVSADDTGTNLQDRCAREVVSVPQCPDVVV